MGYPLLVKWKYTRHSKKAITIKVPKEVVEALNTLKHPVDLYVIVTDEKELVEAIERRRRGR